ncbi:MAG: DUF393 domain-containing protein [Rubripirellula sp.]|nr:DUF393 domain-containing protein [Rubripirellula sp.]
MPEQKSAWKVEVFYDGQCPLCMREIRLLRRLDRHSRIRFSDISADDFSALTFDRTISDFMDEIQGRLPDGEWITGVEVFRRLYAAVGLGSWVSLTRLPGISWGLDVGYRVFAKNRLKLTGRCSINACGIDTSNPGSSRTAQR